MINHRPNPDMRSQDPASEVNSEIEAIMREATELDRQGKLDNTANQRTEARVRQTLEDFDKKVHDHAVTAAQARSAKPGHFLLPKAVRISLGILVLLMVVGVLLELSVGRAFIFSATNEYRSLMPWMFLLLAPTFAAFWLFVEARTPILRSRRCPSWFCWLARFPILVALSCGLVVITPLGWAALFGWATGETTENLDATIVAMDAAHPESRGCRQSADLDYRGTVCSICLDGRIAGPKPSSGDRVVLTGRTSLFGLYIEKVRTN